MCKGVLRQAMVLCLSLVCVAVNAYDAEIGGVYYDFSVSYGEKRAMVTSTSFQGGDYSGDVVIPSSIIYNGEEYTVVGIDANAFYNCSGLTSVQLPSTIRSFGSSAFSGCSSLRSITIPSALTTIYHSVFKGCTSLTSIFIPASVRIFDTTSLSGCTSLMRIDVDANNPYYTSVDGIVMTKDKTSIHTYPAGRSGVYTLPTYITKIYSSAFSGCSKLTGIVLHSNVTEIGSNAFEYCTGLVSVEIPSSVTRFGYGVFSRCTSLASVKLSPNTPALYGSTFLDCSSLTSVTLPASVQSVFFTDFSNCPSLREILVESGSSYLKSVDGVLYSRDGSVLIRMPGSREGTFVVPSDVGSIAQGAFATCKLLSNITLPESLTTIGASAFANCDGLTVMEIPQGVTDVGSYAFLRCKNLLKVTLPDNLEQLPSSLFDNCEALVDVNFPKALKTLGDNVFSGCKLLKRIEIPAGVTTFNKMPFSGMPALERVVSYIVEPFETFSVFDSSMSNVELSVPYGTRDKYLNLSEWNMFGNIIERQSTDLNEQGDTRQNDFSSQIDGDTNLQGNVINDVYFNIDVVNGDGYDTGQGALVLKTTLDGEQLNMVTESSMDEWTLSSAFCGFIFKIPAGKHYVGFDIATQGNVALGVKIGTSDIQTLRVSERSTVYITCEVSEPTFVYVFATPSEEDTHSGAKALNAQVPATTNSVLVYGFSISDQEPSVTAVANIDSATAETDSTEIYDLQGRRVTGREDGLARGLYIVNGKKILINK